MTEYQEPFKESQNHPRRSVSIIILAFAFVSFWALIIALNLKSVPEKTLYQVLSTEYTYSETLNFACEQLDKVDDYVDFYGNIYPSSLEPYLTTLEEARIAFRILYVNYNREPKFKEYESYVGSLKDFAVRTIGHQGIWFHRLYDEACL